MKAIEFTKDEATYILNAVDQAVRKDGIQAAQTGLSIVLKLQESVNPVVALAPPAPTDTMPSDPEPEPGACDSDS